MARCWTCGAYIEKPLFTCPACETVKEIQGLNRNLSTGLDELARKQQSSFQELMETERSSFQELIESEQSNFDDLSYRLSEIAGIQERGFEELSGQLSNIGNILEWFPKLRDATDEQRANWRLIGKGVGIHWEDIDEDLSVEGLLRH